MNERVCNMLATLPEVRTSSAVFANKRIDGNLATLDRVEQGVLNESLNPPHNTAQPPQTGAPPTTAMDSSSRRGSRSLAHSEIFDEGAVVGGRGAQESTQQGRGPGAFVRQWRKDHIRSRHD
jgi:hypothetical protein